MSKDKISNKDELAGKRFETRMFEQPMFERKSVSNGERQTNFSTFDKNWNSNEDIALKKSV